MITKEERKSCIATIEALRNFAINTGESLDWVDDENCNKIIRMLQDPLSPKKQSGSEGAISRIAGNIDETAVIDTHGLDTEIMCAMCRNPMRSDRGCDGACTYDKETYEKIMSIITDRIKPASPEKSVQLTDQEYRIFLAAMARETSVCMEVDKQFADPGKESLTELCRSIKRKVKGTLC